MKSERLKKLEAELQDLEQWQNLGLVPKKDLEKHQREIETIRKKIEEEQERLDYIKQTGEIEEYILPKRNQGKAAFPDSHTIPDIDMGESDMSESDADIESETYDTDTASGYGDDDTMDDRTTFDEDDDPFSDKNRWRRGILEDPESNDW